MENANFFAILILLFVVSFGFVAGLLYSMKGIFKGIAIFAVIVAIVMGYFSFETEIKSDIEIATETRLNQQELIDNFYNFEPGTYKIVDYKLNNYYPLLEDSLDSFTLENGDVLLIPGEKLRVEFYHPQVTQRIEDGKSILEFIPAEIESDSLEIRRYEVKPLVFENFAVAKISP